MLSSKFTGGLRAIVSMYTIEDLVASIIRQPAVAKETLNP